MKSFSCFLFLALFTQGLWAQYAPHQMPPGGLSIDNTPQFIILSFDDNNNINNVLALADSLSKFKNPTGATTTTFEGKSVPAVWYNNGSAVSSQSVRSTMKTLADVVGSEIANHTYSHNSGKNGFVMTRQQWRDEIEPGIPLIGEDAPVGMGLPHFELGGFRAPRLEINDSLYQVLSELGYRYDTSLEDGYQDSIDGSNFFWPYKLSNSGGEGWDFLLSESDTKEPLSAHPELWEIPISPYLVSDSMDADMATKQDWHTLGTNKMTGFDYNIFAQFGYNSDQMGNILKLTLDKRLAGNRAPLMVGLHSDNYAPGSDSARGIYEFVQYAIQNPNVRFVTAMELLDWMESPVGLDGQGFTSSLMTPAFPELKFRTLPNKFQFNQEIPKHTHIDVLDTQGRSHISKVVPSQFRELDVTSLSSGLYRVVLTHPTSQRRQIFMASVN